MAKLSVLALIVASLTLPSLAFAEALVVVQVPDRPTTSGGGARRSALS